ncbi:MAG: choice-of-anchor Q domain-containing protein [Acidimicrobiia bacterium]
MTPPRRLLLITGFCGVVALTGLLPQAASAGLRKLYISPHGSNSSRCTKARPCRSFYRAYRVARLGQVVIVRGGTYGTQVLDGDGAKARRLARARDVVFRSAPGAKVKVKELEIRVPHVQFHRMRIVKWKADYDVRDPRSYAAGDLTFRRIRTHHFSLTSVRHVRVIGGSVGPNRGAPSSSGRWPQDGVNINAWPQDRRPPKDILIKGVRIHDIREPNTSAHSDCIQVTAGINVRFVRNRIWNCEHAGLMIKGDQGPIRGFRIENNYLGRTLSAYYSINLYQTSRGCKDVLMRNNTALQNIRLDSCSGGRMTGTIQPSMKRHTCSAAKVKLSWNVFESGIRCGRTNRVGRARFVNRARLDLALRLGSAAINRGNPRSFPGVDIRGQKRPKGNRPDAGAFERR